MPSALERARELVGAVLGAREHQHLLPAVLADQVREQFAPCASRSTGWTRCAIISTVELRGVDLDRARVRRGSLPASAWISSEKVAENSRFWRCARQQRDHALDVGDEAHVEHAVGFVEHEDLDARQVDVALLHVVEQASRRRHQDVDAALAARVVCGPKPTPPNTASRRQRQVLAVGPDRRLDLRGELARRREDQRARRAPRPPVARRRRRKGAAGSAARSRRSCRCRSARRRGGRRRRARPEWPAPGSASAWCSLGRRPRAAARRTARVD